MNQFKKYILFLVLITINSFAQPNKEYVKHTVLAGENITQIAKKYKVTPYDIYLLNPESKNGINENDILLISLRDYKVEIKETKKERKEREKLEALTVENYTVIAKDTKFSLAKKFKISIEDLEKWNPEIVTNGLQEGQVINVKEPKKEVVDYSKINTSLIPGKYVIQPEDTKYGIAKKFEVTIEELEAINPQIKNKFPVGTELFVPKIKKETEVIEEIVYEQYTIKSKETLYGISKKFNVSQMEILKLNPELNYGFKEGLTIKIPNENLQTKFPVADKTKLVAKKSDVEKKLVLLLPFNIPFMESDTIKSKTNFLKSKDGRLTNMALEYYSGAIIAIDSAKKLGYNLKVKIIDFESTKTSNNLPSIVEKNDFSKVNAVIGPFINSQVEQAAILLEKYQIPIISPLSSKNGKPYSNIYYSMPSEELQREVLFEYFKDRKSVV